MPEAGLGVLVPGQAGGLDNQAVPLGVDLAPDDEGLERAVFIAAVAPEIDTLEAVGRDLGGGDAFERGQQACMVGFDLGEQCVADVSDELKRFLAV